MKLRPWMPAMLFVSAALAAPPPTPPTSPANDVDEADGTPGTEGEDAGAALLEKDGPKAPKPAATLVAEATRIVTNAKATSYSHKTVVDEAALRFDVDCSGFIGYLLRRVAPQARRELVAGTVKRPLAKHFVSFIGGLPDKGAGRWARIDDARHLRAGDIIAWNRAADSKSTNTGHVMLVGGPATRRGAHAVKVPIFDSTALPHGDTDKRAAGSPSGVGQGFITLRTDRSGKPLAFRWSPTGGYKYHETEIVMARMKAE